MVKAGKANGFFTCLISADADENNDDDDDDDDQSTASSTVADYKISALEQVQHVIEDLNGVSLRSRR